MVPWGQPSLRDAYGAMEAKVHGAVSTSSRPRACRWATFKTSVFCEGMGASFLGCAVVWQRSKVWVPTVGGQATIKDMNSLRFLALSALCFFVSTALVIGRAEPVWSEEELVAKADLVVIATPTTTKSTTERTKLEWWNLIGVETQFSVSKVIKGDQTIKTVILHHYRYAKDEHGPGDYGLLSFDPAKNQSFRLFLVREPSGRYTPVAGQLDNLGDSVQIIRK